MQNSGGAAILMQQVFEKIAFVCGNAETLMDMPKQRALKPFSTETADFLDTLSGEIRKDPAYRTMPDAASFAFWCRRANVDILARSYDTEHRLGRGVALHFAPSNIPVLFAFSMAAGLMAGNCCAVRLPSAVTEQAEMICRAVARACEKHPEFKKRIALFRTSHDKEITDALSSICDVRIIWGGDRSVSDIRRSPLPPRAVELPFSDRQSAAVIDAKALLAEEDLTDVLRGFYNDTYLNDQNACSSPRIVYWLGESETVKNAKERFWSEFGAFVKEKYNLQTVSATQKYTEATTIAAVTEGAEIISDGNYVVRVSVPELRAEMWLNTAPGGYFIEASGESLEGILPVLTDHCQTIGCFGDVKENLSQLIEESGVKGCDRIVSFGQTLDFDLIWDGHDLIETMSRKITIK